MKLTPFGKLVRRHRIEKEISLGEMSNRIGVSSAFASAVETGTKRIPNDYASKVSKALGLNRDETAELSNTADISAPEVRFQFDKSTSQFDRELVNMFARRFPNLPEDKKSAFRTLLEEEGVE